ncbi:hypothetical protein DFP73DRAFT_520399 [Morchella snyderi]|nr:hypothetical protein DFP73DRAFT_520399 [Morchella snyderi]
MDKYGDLAAAVSSGGPAGEAGDPTTMPEICAGIMCDNNCAVVCAGTNEDLAEYEPARIVCMLKRDPTETIKGAVDQVFDFLFEKDCNPHSIIAVDRTGAIEIRSNTRVHLVSTCSNLAGSWTRVHGNSTPVTPHHLVRCDAFVEAGFTRYPICEGQIVATLKDCSNLSDLNYSQFMQTMVSIWSMSLALSASLDAPFVGLACNGTGTLSLLPFDDKQKNWAGKHYERMQRDTNLPYLTSKKGEDIYSAGLTAMVHKKLGAAEPKDFSIKGETDENNYYTRVIRGQVTHHRIWEDHEHVAFLDPHGSSVGMTILVPRKQIRGDVFSMKSANFVSLMRATYKVIQLLRDGLEDDRVGVFFDGYDESFASVILIPTRDPVKENCAPNRVGKAQFYDIHPGYLSTQIGRRIQGFSDLTDLKENYLRLEESKKDEKDARDARDAKIANGGKEGKEMKETKVSLLKSQSRKVSSLRLVRNSLNP